MAASVTPLDIPEVLLIAPDRFGDARGFFSETYNRRWFDEAGLDLDFVQDNHSYSAGRGTIRGLHYQVEPHAQDKLVRVIRGSVLDVAVDLRRGSPSFGRHVAEELSADNVRQLFVPKGFAHAFCTLEDHTEVVYKVTGFYAPDCDRSLRWNDPALGIAWPVAADEAILSNKDAEAPLLSETPDAFTYAD